jgi:hypothetical protein
MKTSAKIQSTTSGVTSATAGFIDNRDCSVRALANAADMPYLVAHRLLEKHGRKMNRGVYFDTLDAAYKEAGFTLQGIYGTTRPTRYAAYKTGIEPQEGTTLGKLLPKLKVGEYIVNVCGHALAVVNGKVLDTFDNAAGKRVVAVYKRV